MTKASAAKIVKTALEANKIVLGRDATLKGLKAGKVTGIIFASNCPLEWKTKFEAEGKSGKAEFYDYKGNGLDLGALCKKPFAVTVAGILK